MSNLLEIIASTKPRETGGSIAQNRFDYQQDWSLCKILDLHLSTDDYLFCFEYHDDVTIMDSSTIPTKFSFYQIKTKNSGSWTTNNLLKRKQGSNGKSLCSILGKSYYNFTQFKEYTERIYFVTNASFNLKLKDKSDSRLKTIIHGTELSCDEINKINSSIQEEISSSNEIHFENITHFEVSELPVKSHDKITQANLSIFIEQLFPDTKYIISLVYQMISSEIKRKAICEKPINTQSDLLKYKSICKKDIEYFLNKCVLEKRDSISDICDKIEHRLNSESIDYSFIHNFRKHCTTIEIERMDRNSRLLFQITQIIRNIIKGIEEVDMKPTLFECMNVVFNKYNSHSIKQNIYTDDYLKALILLAFYEK